MPEASSLLQCDVMHTCARTQTQNKKEKLFLGMKFRNILVVDVA